MSIDLARSILSATDDDRLDLIFEHDDAFIWDEYGDEVEQFNRIIASYPDIRPARIVGSDEDIRMTYKATTVKVPVERDGQDNLRAVVALAGLTRQDLAFRMCVDTDGNSEFAFLMLPPNQWSVLESEFGAEAVSACFLPVGDSCEALFEMLAAGAEPLSPLELAAKEFADKVEALALPDVSSSVSFELDDDNYLSLDIETPTDRERDRLFSDPEFLRVLNKFEPELRDQGLILQSVVIESEETIQRDWGGIRFQSLSRAYSPHLWFSRNPRPREEEPVDTALLLQMLGKDK
jgi:hypothetical protein